MTPHRSSHTISFMYVAGKGNMISNNVTVFRHIRPVINLKSDIQITGGDGSKSNPYIVE